jgi:hypothetical protein
MQTDVHRTRSASGRRGQSYGLFAAPAAVVFAALAFCGPAAAAPTTPVAATAYLPTQGPGASSHGIIMRDGGICDPIRHMGC